MMQHMKRGWQSLARVACLKLGAVVPRV